MINSSTQFHLVGYFFMNCTMMHGSMNIKNTAVLRVYHFEIDQGGLPGHSINSPRQRVACRVANVVMEVSEIWISR